MPMAQHFVPRHLLHDCLISLLAPPQPCRLPVPFTASCLAPFLLMFDLLSWSILSIRPGP